MYITTLNNEGLNINTVKITAQSLFFMVSHEAKAEKEQIIFPKSYCKDLVYLYSHKSLV